MALKLTIKKNILLSSLLFSIGCSNAPITGDRRLNPHEIPVFMAVYKDSKYHKAEFFEKGGKKNKSFEVKYLEDRKEVSLAFDKNGRLMEKEVDTDMDALSPQVKNKIVSYMKEHYSGFIVLEVELRQEDQLHDFIDIEIRHKSSKSGYWELSFTPEGDFVSREVEDYASLETLN